VGLSTNTWWAESTLEAEAPFMATLITMNDAFFLCFLTTIFTVGFFGLTLVTHVLIVGFTDGVNDPSGA
jgi:hypothetical protein